MDELDLLQLLDSAFPIGSYAHSGGFEALCKLTDTGFPNRTNLNLSSPEAFSTLDRLILSILDNTGSLHIPFLRDAFLNADTIKIIAEIDARLHIMMSNHVAKRASLQQGKSLASTSAQVFIKHRYSLNMHDINSAISSHQMAGHFPVVFACMCRFLGATLEQTARYYLFGQLRTVLGSAVRMGIIGPLKGQEIQNRFQRDLVPLSEKYLAVPEPCICNPVLEVIQSAHDKLFAKLFYS
ncbi:uncharacterized protein LOC129593625 isoform X2 [Paramacrobiotus metropolitanus]|uniref:uncharacterized protein LOC129593625 isoform X2 n=1 Tax=Paramacrobiotus metropolitanus TaxID=2943436 RepID=UPI002446314C|nr:uncharacterized protein LOC129593625 isoform X2 [Paramacrobiotus metropolitanus]